MLALVFDTETSGLIDYRRPNTHPDQPDIVQLCAKMSLDGKIVSSVNLFVHGDIPIGDKAYEVHRIDRAMTEKIGVSRKRMCFMFQSMAEKADVIVGHNIDFDIRMMQIAMQREGGTGEIFSKKARYCTMKEATSICRIPNPKKAGEYKWPSLAEAYSILVDPRGFPNAHDAEADVNACHEVYRVLLSRTNRAAS